MTLDKYPILSNEKRTSYEFLSEGPKGTIKKVVYYQEIGDDLFNLAFGDWDEERQAINDRIRSNNNDRDKVLVTVASTVIDFINQYPNASIFAEGVTAAKTRLYQMGINQNWAIVSHSFDIKGYCENNWEPFTRNKNYEAFILKAKK